MRALVSYRWWALALLLLGLGLLLPGAQRASVPDNALKVWFLETDPQLKAYDEFHREFGNDEIILVFMESDEAILSRAGLSKLNELSERLEAVPGVERVHSLLSMRDAWRVEDADGNGTVHFDRAIAGSLDRLTSHPLIVDRLLRADGKATLLWVEMAVMDDFDAQRDAIVTEVRDTADAVLSDTVHAIGGLGVIYSGLNLITQHDFGLFVGIGFLIIFFAFGRIFRSGRLVAAAIVVVVSGTLVSLGVYGLAGHRLNMVTVVLPTLIIVLGLADVVHFPPAFVRQQEANPGAPRSEQVAAALKEVFLPCLMTTVTTMAGFAALVSSPMAVIRHLGTYAALGLGAALVTSWVVMAVALMALPTGWRPPPIRWIRGPLAALQGALMHRRALLGWSTVGLVVLAGIGASQVVTDTYTLGYLPDDHRVVQDHELIQERWGDYSVLDFLVRPADGQPADSPEILEATHRFQRAAEAEQGVRLGYGLHSVYRRLAGVLGAKVSDDAPLPDDLVAQLSLLLDIQGFSWDRAEPQWAENVLGPWINEDHSLGRLTLVGSMASAVEVDALLERLAEHADAAMGDLGTIEPAGYPPLYTRIVDYAMTSQIRGFFLALGVIFVAMLLWLRDLRLALIALPPNVFPVAVMMGVMGGLGIHLDIATATVAAIVIGVSIDDTVHFLLHWKEAEDAGMPWEAAVEHVFERAGLPAIITTTLLVLGYPVLMLAQVKTVVAFGLLTTVAAFAALWADLVLLPLLLRLVPSRRSQ